ncbi:MAG: alpha-L-fucosidase [Planctomycetota bacterium]|nr:alpha-L-fucosidase [Planctomycetota bacterium]
MVLTTIVGRLWPTLLSAILLAAPVAAAEKDAPYLKAAPDDLAWWRQARFGLFVHWGPVSLKGTEIGWSRGGERRGRRGKGPIPVEVYDNLYKTFNPIKFDADEWVRTAKAAGMKYLVFTTKHHDGFSMFDSALTEYKITRSPYGKDIVGQLAEACHKGGLRLGFYYSPPDWHHPDYRTERHAKYIAFLHGQIRELCTNYGRLDVLWFDGLGGRADDWNSPPLFKMVRDLQPHILINNRAGLPGDFDTPEQRVGRFQIDRPWETCMTICRQWAWKPDDALKSLQQCVHTLVRCTGGDGNLLLNVGPMPDGRIEPRQVDRLKEIGAWLHAHGESIYGTRGGPFKPGPYGASTRKANRIYLHVLAWPGEAVQLPAIGHKVTAASVLGGGKAEVEQTDDGLAVRVPMGDRKEIDTVVVLDLDGPASDIAPAGWSSGSVAAGKKASASNVFGKQVAQFGPAKAVDDDPATRWATDAGTREAWIEVDLGKPTRIARVMIDECVAYGQRVKKFRVEAETGGAWQTVLEGAKIGRNFTKTFDPVTARRVRLAILEATDGPTVSEVQLFGK